MAKKPATATTQELPPAMDYAEHNATWLFFTGLIKWAVIASAILCVALYFFIEGHQPLIGWLLLLAMVVGAVALLILRSRRPD